MIPFLALRNLWRMRRRYTLIALAVLVGFALVLLVSGAAFGALEAMKGKAARYFAGDVSIQGFPDRDRTHQRIRGAGALAEELLQAGLGIRSATPRSIYYGENATLLFGGETVRQRRLVGIDFGREAAAFAGLACVEGSVTGMSGEGGRRGILVSEAAARILGARLGDEVTVALTTDSGQHNTVTLEVRGVFRETSLFGYLAYLQSGTFNELTGRPADAATDIAIYGAPGSDGARLAERVRLYLEARGIPTLGPISTKDEVDVRLKSVKAATLAVLPLEGNLSQMKDIVQAFLAVTWVAVLIFVGIAMVGILNTFRVIAYERTREIGTMRAIGMQAPQVLALFVVEALALAFAACLGGFAVGGLGFALLRALDLSSVPAAGLFTEGGRLGFLVDPGTVVLDFTIMLFATAAAAFGPARRAAAADPAEALRTEQ